MSDESNVDEGHGSVTPQTGPRAGQKIYKTHEDSIIGGIKGLIMGGAKRSDTGNKAEDSALNAVASGASEAPGNSADY